MTNIRYFEITSLSFDIRTKIGVCALAKPHAIFQTFLLKMLGFNTFNHSFTASNFNPIAVLKQQRFKQSIGVLHVFSMSKRLPVSIYKHCQAYFCSVPKICSRMMPRVRIFSK